MKQTPVLMPKLNYDMTNGTIAGKGFQGHSVTRRETVY
jgi:hypothetical protein